MGFHRKGQPALLDRATLTVVVTRFVAEEIAPLVPADPFGLDHDCLNPTGHHFVGSCGDVVCMHCARIAWQ